MDIIKENSQMISVNFDSILDVIDQPCISKSERNKTLYHRFFRNYASRFGWLGPYKNEEELIKSVLLGDENLYKTSLLPKISMLKGGSAFDYEQKIQKVKRVRTHDVIGDELDIHRVYQGNFQKAWRKTKRVEVSEKLHLVTLLIEYHGNSNEDAMDSLWRAAVAVKLADELESAGKSVQIVVGSVCTGAMRTSGKKLSTSYVIKRFNEKLNLYRLAAMSHLGFFRVFGFAALASQDHDLTSGFGRAFTMTEDTMPIHLKEEVDSGHTKFVHIGRANSFNRANTEIEKCYDQMNQFAMQK